MLIISASESERVPTPFTEIKSTQHEVNLEEKKKAS